MPASPERRAAYRVLDRSSRRNETLSAALNASLHSGSSCLPAGSIRDLVWGVSRRQLSLDWLIDRFSSRGGGIAGPPRIILRLALYELLYADPPVPAHASVNEAVDLAGEFAPRARALVNAVLRAAVRAAGSLPWPAESSDAAGALAVTQSHPRWLVDRWVARFGLEETRAICAANNAPAPISLRINETRTTRAILMKELEDAGLNARESAHVSTGVLLDGRPELGTIDAFRGGRCWVQDEASQIAAQLLAGGMRGRIIDLCCGSGIKTLCHAMRSPGAHITAVDNSPARIARARALLSRAGRDDIELREADVLTLACEPAEAVFLDAPCTGLGTLRRKPDIKWRISPRDCSERLPQLQKKMISSAARLVSPGGVLVYVTCSSEPEEGENISTWFLDNNPGFTAEVPTGIHPDLCTGTSMRTRVDRHDMDGFFGAVFRRSLT